MLRLLLMLGSVLTLAVTVDSQAQEPGPFLHADEVSWKVNDFPVARWKTLIGGIEGGQIPQQDVQFGLWELAPNAIYHGHKHDAPEIYYIIAGQAQWSVGDETRDISAGTVVYTVPGAVHKMVNLTNDPVTARWMWWAPGGDAEVFADQGKWYSETFG